MATLSLLLLLVGLAAPAQDPDPGTILELAHRYAEKGDYASSRRHFEELLKRRGEDPYLLVTMSRLCAPTREDLRDLLLRAVRAELAGPGSCGSLDQWRTRYRPDDAERKEMVRIHEEALAKGADRVWVRIQLMELHGDLKDDEAALGQARAIVKLVEQGKGDLSGYWLEQVVGVFLRHQGHDDLRRLQQAFASKGEKAAGEALLVEGELVAAIEDTEGILRHLEERYRPPPGKFPPFHGIPLDKFMEALRRRKKISAVARRLAETPAGGSNESFHLLVAQESLQFLSGSEESELTMKVMERKHGRTPSTIGILTLARQLVGERRWQDAMARAGEVLQRKGAGTEDRADAQHVRALCFEGMGDFEKAIEACDRALGEKAGWRTGIHMTRTRALLALKRPDAAVEALASAFSEVIAEADPRHQWPLLRGLLDGIRAFSKEAGARDALAGAAARKDDPGAALVLALALEAQGKPQDAADAMGKATAARPDHPALLYELALAEAAADRPVRAVEPRARLSALTRENIQTRKIFHYHDVDKLNQKIVEACERADDVEAGRKFARSLAEEPMEFFFNDRALAEMLLIVREEEFTREIDATLARTARTEHQKVLARYPAALARASLGDPRGADAYRTIAEGEGWSEQSRRSARGWIQSLEKMAREYVEPIGAVRKHLEQAMDKDDPISVQGALNVVAGPEAIRDFRKLDREWKADMRQGKADLLHFMIGGLRHASAARRLACLEKVTGLHPGWKVKLGYACLELREKERAAAIFMDVLRGKEGRIYVENGNGHLASHLHRLQQDGLRELGRGLTQTGAGRWGWTLLWLDPAGREEHAEKWLTEAQSGTERAAARIALESMRAAREGREIPWDTVAEALYEKGSDPAEVIIPMRFTLRPVFKKSGEKFWDLLRKLRMTPPGSEVEAEVRKHAAFLPDKDLHARTAAREALIRIGPPAVHALVGLIDHPDADLRIQARELIRILLLE